jgi:hypothetical protein
MPNSKGILTLIHREVESKWLRSAWVSARFASVFTIAIMNLPMWNLALMKSGSLARELVTQGNICSGFSTRGQVESP